MSLFQESKIAPVDRGLFRRLKFIAKPISCDGHWHVIGTWKTPEGATVRVLATALPAIFWRFEIINVEERDDAFDTGSGYLTTYWPTVELIASGMFTVADDQEPMPDDSLQD